MRLFSKNKLKGTEYYYSSLDEVIDFYYKTFVENFEKDERILMKKKDEIKSIFHRELSCFEFNEIRWQVKNNFQASNLKQFNSELGHLTGIWGIDWAWIFHHIRNDFLNVKYGLNLIELFGKDDILVYKYLPNKYYDIAENLYLKNKKTREPNLYTVRELISNGNGLNSLKKFKPVLGVNLWSGFSNDLWDSTENYIYEKDSYWDNESKAYKLKEYKSKYDVGHLVKIKIGDKEF